MSIFALGSRSLPQKKIKHPVRSTDGGINSAFCKFSLMLSKDAASNQLNVDYVRSQILLDMYSDD